MDSVKSMIEYIKDKVDDLDDLIKIMFYYDLF